MLVILLLPREKKGKEVSALPKVSIGKTIAALVQNKPLLLYVCGNTVLFGVNQMVTIFLVQLCYAQVDIPLSMFGFPFLLLVGISSAFSLLSAPFTTRLGAFPATVVAFMLSFVGLLLLSSLQGVVFVLVGAVLIRLGSVLVQPLYFSVTAKVSEGSDLATSLSLNSLFGTCIELLLTLALGYLAGRDLVLSLQIAGGMLLFALWSIYYGRSILQGL